MKWSQLKKRIKATFADSVNGRVDLHTTRYHKAHDSMGRAWITVDGEEIVNMCSFKAEMTLWREATRLRKESGCTDWTNPEQKEGYYRAYDEADRFRKAARPEFHQSLFNYLNLSIDRVLGSPDPLIRAIGMLDKRTGKRRLASMDVANEHPLVRKLHKVRCEAEEGAATAG